jgi:hypothetical protein
MQDLKAKHLFVDCETPYVDRQVLLGHKHGALLSIEEERFRAYEFENGLIRVPGLPTSDRYFNDRVELRRWCPVPTMRVVKIIDSDFSCTFPLGKIHDSINRSIVEFGEGSILKKCNELLAPMFQAIAPIRVELDRLGATSITVVPDEEASEDLRIEEVDGSCYSDHLNVELTLANWSQLPDGIGSKAAWRQLVDSGRPVLRNLN